MPVMHSLAARVLRRLAMSCLTATALSFFVPLALHADERVSIPEDVASSLTTLIDRVQGLHSLQAEDIMPLLDFARDTAPTRDDWDVPDLRNATGGYYGYGIAAPVDWIVERIYHPDLPPSFFHPSVVRVSKWMDEPKENIPERWKGLEEGQLVTIRGKGLEENTPDVTTGGYYTYHNDRLVVLLRQQDKKYLLSVSKQTDESTVGRKGVVIGDDQDWNYFYTDEQGLTARGLGWVDSYMFDSFSVSVLAADPDDPKRSRHTMFKWVRAGWSGMNMVRPSHVRNGCQRFAQSLIRLMESADTPDLDTLVAMSRRVQAMDEQEIQQTLQPYIENLRDVGSADPTLSRRSFQRLLHRDNPLEHYPLHAKQSLVMKEFLKTSLGMPALLTVNQDEILVSFLR